MYVLVIWVQTKSAIPLNVSLLELSQDQLQEMKAKTNMEGKYIKKSADVGVAQTQKRCMMEEKNMKDDTEVYVSHVDGTG